MLVAQVSSLLDYTSYTTRVRRRGNKSTAISPLGAWRHHFTRGKNTESATGGQGGS